MNFIGRPNMSEGIWQRAIQLAADKNNPFVDQMNQGMATMGQGMQALGQQYNQKQHDERSAAAVEQRDQKEGVRKKELEAYTSYLSTVRDLAKNGLLKPMNKSVDDGSLNTHSLAQQMGAPKPEGLPMGIDKPVSGLDQKKAFFDYKMQRMGFGGMGGSKDPLVAATVNIMRGMTDLLDADDSTLTNTYDRIYQSLKKSQGGKYQDRPVPEKPAPVKKPSIFDRLTGSSSTAPGAAPASKGGYDWRKADQRGTGGK